MPELAEVEFFRRRWWEAAARQTMLAADVNPRSRVFRGFVKDFAGDTTALAKSLSGAKLTDSGTHGKQMWFVFHLGAKKEKFLWLGMHLGMTGHLRVELPDYRAQKHDAILLRFAKHTLVFNDARQFGRIRASLCSSGERPPWLRNLPVEILSPVFTPAFVRGVCARHARAPLKAVLLNQKYFPGIGNWMADEILWRAALHPALPAGRAATLQIAKKLHAAIQQVTRAALRVIAGQGKKLPSDHNMHIPDTWLFNHRWEKGGVCPKTQKPLHRAEIGGRTTCWSPARQKLPR